MSAGLKYTDDLILVAVNLVGDAFRQVLFDSRLQQQPTCLDVPVRPDEPQAPVIAASEGNVLGFITLRSLSTTLNDLRNVMFQQIEALPTQFTFLSKEGWPVSNIQETTLLLYYIVNDKMMINIRRQFEKQRFGIQTIYGAVLGFVFAEMENTAEEIHELIVRELETLISDQNTFVLIDKNGWPVALHQEKVLRVWDLMVNGVFRIMPIRRNDRMVHDVTDYAVSEPATAEIESRNTSPGPIGKRKRLSGASTVDINMTSKPNDGNNNLNTSLVSQPLITHENSLQPTVFHPLPISAKPILISYVRAEAEHHARQLKSELNDLGCNVFLDVDEIECGHDWQDALNSAVLNCDLFVPLITPKYGYTVWTNREVKLADIKQKQIIPVSFLDQWPPECLAIQFASTQYIPWKKVTDIEKSIKNGEAERARDIRFWDQPYVRITAKAIADNYKMLQANQLPAIHYHQFHQPPEIVEIPAVTASIANKEIDLNQKQASNHKVNYRKNIVVSAHPKQSNFVSLIRNELSEMGFDVWSSTDMAIGTTANTNLTPPYSSQPMPNISYSLENDPENEQTLHIASQNSESSQDSHLPGAVCFRPRLTFSLSNEQINYPQCSQFSEIGSQTCLFSPEDFNKAKHFRGRVDEASIVIIIFSNDYYRSSTCKQQAFYCEGRKKVIPIKVDDFRLPHCFSKFYDGDILERLSEKDELLMFQLKERVKTMASQSRYIFRSEMIEARIEALSVYLEKSLPMKQSKRVYVYVAGSCKMYYPPSEAISRAIGQGLASIPLITLITGGYFGVSETVARSFCEERELIEKPASLYHILPRYESEDASHKARQNPDGTLQELPFGHTIFLGNSFKDRDSLVARAFNYCILIEGGPRSAKIAEEFTWNDNIVIPIMCTGGAASGKFDLPEKIQDVPMGVHKDDWSTLMRRDVTAENIAEAVKNIVCSLVKCRSIKKEKSSRNQTQFKIAKSMKSMKVKQRLKR